MLHENLYGLRKQNGLTQEQIAEQLGVSRQAVAKWESGETIPDLTNCAALAKLYDVSIDDLVNFESTDTDARIPPRGKHLFGTVTVGEKGQIVIPKKARKIFGIEPGDSLLVLGDEAQGLAIIKADAVMDFIRRIKEGED